MKEPVGPLLADLLAQISQALNTAQKNLLESGKAPMLAIKTAEVEVNFVLEKQTGGKLEGKSSKWIPVSVAVGGERQYRSEQVNRIKLVLESRLSSAEDWRRFSVVEAEPSGGTKLTIG